MKSKSLLHTKYGIWGSVPILLLQDGRLTPNAIRVFIALSSFQGVKDFSYPSVEAIAKRAGIGRSSISAATACLETNGWLKKTRHGDHAPNSYELYCYSEPVDEFKKQRKARTYMRDSDNIFTSEIRNLRKSRNPQNTDDEKSVLYGNKKTILTDQDEKASPLTSSKNGGQRRKSETYDISFQETPKKETKQDIHDIDKQVARSAS